jgi:uncharacterized repeat protein (TIGR03943 family)
VNLSARPARAVVLVAWAGLFLVLWLGGHADRYLGPRTTWVAAFGAITLTLAAIGYGVIAVRDRASRPLSRFEALGLFALLVPILAIVLVPRAELGAQAARKKSTSRSIATLQAVSAKKAAAQAAAAAAEDAGQGVAKIDFLSIASITSDSRYASDLKVQPGIRVHFVGFALSGDRPGRFRLARFLVSCCVADAVPVFVDVKATLGMPSDNMWLDITGKLLKERGGFIVVPESMKPVDQPRHPYLTTWNTSS